MRMIRSDWRFRSQQAANPPNPPLVPCSSEPPKVPRILSLKVAEVRFIRLVVATSLERTGRSRLQSSPPGLRFLGFDGVSRIAIPGQWCNRAADRLAKSRQSAKLHEHFGERLGDCWAKQAETREQVSSREHSQT